jgi:hypothetical protein
MFYVLITCYILKHVVSAEGVFYALPYTLRMGNTNIQLRKYSLHVIIGS